MLSDSPYQSRSISHQEWLRLLDIQYPKGRNPWRDIYDEETTLKLGAIIQIQKENKDELFRLRSVLAQAAEMMSTFPMVFGDINPKSTKLNWIEQAQTKASNLLQHLQQDERFAPEHAGQPQYRAQIAELEKQLMDFLSTLDSTAQSDLGSSPTTLHADFLQFVVDRLTDVFMQFRTKEDVRRVSSGGVYGAFPEFIRASAQPYLMINYQKYRLKPKQYEKLDRQIQNAVARIAGNFEQYHRQK